MTSTQSTDQQTWEYLCHLFTEEDLIDVRLIPFSGGGFVNYQKGRTAAYHFITNHVRQGQTDNVFVGVAPRRSDAEKSNKRNCASLNTLWVDLDGENEEEYEKYVALARDEGASMAVRTGPFGIHAYFTLDKRIELTPENIQRVENIHRGMIAKIGADPSTKDVSRVLRVPGTTNLGSATKSKEKMEAYPALCELLWTNGNRFSLDGFAEIEAAGAAEQRGGGNARGVSTINPNAVFSEGSRHDALKRHGTYLKKKGLSQAQVNAALVVFNRERCKPPKGEDEIADVIAWIFSEVDTEEVSDVEKRAEAIGVLNVLLDFAKEKGVVEAKTLYLGEETLRQPVVNAIVTAPDRWDYVALELAGLAKHGEKGMAKAFISALKSQSKVSKVSSTVIESTPPRFPLTERGNALRFQERYANELVWVPELGHWREYDGRKWVDVPKGYGLTDKFAPVAADVEADILAGGPPTNREFAWIESCQSTRVIIASLKQAGDLMRRGVSDFDQHDYKLNTPQMVFDLEAIQWESHRPDLFLTQISHGDAGKPGCWKNGLWEKVIERGLPDPATRACFQRAVGYSLCHDNPEQVLFFCYGEPSAGKNTIMDAILLALGDYARTASFDTFVLKKFKNDNAGLKPDIMALKGRRFVFADEGDRYARFDAAQIKALTGGAEISARGMRQETQVFKLPAKLWFASNHRAQIDYDDGGMWRRMVIFPFVHVIPEGERDTSIQRKLRHPDVQRDILMWALDGWAAYRNTGGLYPSPEMLEEHERYRQDSNPLAEFVHKYCNTSSDPKMRCSLDEIWDHYQEVYANKRDRLRSKTSFRDYLKAQPGVEWKKARTLLPDGTTDPNQSARRMFIHIRPKRWVRPVGGG